jgi:hypothetical protein
VFATPVPMADGTVLASLRKSFQLRHVFAGGGFLRAQAPQGADASSPLSVAPLAAIAEQLVWLDLSAARLPEERLTGLEKLGKLQRLDLSGSHASDRTVSLLTGLPHLEVLNLYGTQVSDSSLAAFARMPALASVYLTGTAVTGEGVERFARAHPRIKVIWQATPADDTVIIREAPGVAGERKHAESPPPAA